MPKLTLIGDAAVYMSCPDCVNSKLLVEDPVYETDLERVRLEIVAFLEEHKDCPRTGMARER